MPASQQRLRLPKRLSGSQQDVIALSQLGASPPPQDQVDNDGGRQPVSAHWRSLCYFLHAFLVVIHLILLGIAASHHPERRVVVLNDVDVFAAGLSGGLQAFYILYTALLVFVTQRLMLSSIFSRPNKLNQIHDICGAWAGLGAALSALWQQTKVPSSVLSIALVAVYFACISLLHVTSSILIQLQLFNDTTTNMVAALGTWPNASINLTSLDWATVTAPVPFLQDMYGNTTDGLANNTLYDIPQSDFINATVYATTVNAQCGLLTNLSIAGPNASASTAAVQNGIAWDVTASMTALGPVTILIWFPPFLGEVWLSAGAMCFEPEPICSTLILYLVTAEMEVDDSLSGVNHVYINGTYSPPGGTTEIFSTPIYLIACSLNSTNHTVSLDSSGVQLDSGVQPMDVIWSAFSPAGDPNLTSVISSAIVTADSILGSPNYCQPILSPISSTPWTSIPAFNAYIGSLLGMGTYPCDSGASLPAQYTSTPPLLTKYQVESVVAQTAAQFLWLAGEIGSAGGGFDRQTVEAAILPLISQWRLNINTLPVIFALCASVILFVLVVCALWRHNPGAVSSAGVLEMMWFGSRSRVLRRHLSDVQTPSLDSLRAASMFETVFWTLSPNKYDGSSGPYAPVSRHDLEPHTSSSRSMDLSVSETEIPSLSDVPRDSAALHRSNTSRNHHWCYALHIVLVALHVALLALLVHHPEQSVVIPSKTSTLTIGLSAFLQGFYTLYTAILVLLMQRLALAKIISGRRKLTTIHDVSGAWTGIGAAINILWQQRRASSSIWEVFGAGAYLALMLILHITSSTVIQWQEFNSTLTGVVQTNLAMPDSAVNFSQFQSWEIFPIVESITPGSTSTLTTQGLLNTTLYDVVQNPSDTTFTSATVNATTITAQCGLVLNLTLSDENTNGEYQITFQNGTNNGGFLEPPEWKDIVNEILPNIQCTACPQTIFYMVTTGIDVDGSVDETVVVGLNWTYTPPGGNPQTSTTATYIAACSVNAQTAPAILNIQLEELEMAPNQTAVGPLASSWSVWSPEIATNLSVGIATALWGSISTTYSVNDVSAYTNVDMYIMSLLGLNLSYAIAVGANQSSANPTVTLSPWQLENAIAQTVAKFLWVAGQVGENGGGFQRSVGQSQASSNIVQFRLHLNTVPVLMASIATFLSLVLAMVIIGKPSGKRVGLVSGTSVLECLWLEAHSESIHAHMKTAKDPHLDRLRVAGMFDICLGDIGRSSYPEMQKPILNPADE